MINGLEITEVAASGDTRMLSFSVFQFFSFDFLRDYVGWCGRGWGGGYVERRWCDASQRATSTSDHEPASSL